MRHHIADDHKCCLGDLVLPGCLCQSSHCADKGFLILPGGLVHDCCRCIRGITALDGKLPGKLFEKACAKNTTMVAWCAAKDSILSFSVLAFCLPSCDHHSGKHLERIFQIQLQLLRRRNLRPDSNHRQCSPYPAHPSAPGWHRTDRGTGTKVHRHFILLLGPAHNIQ